MEESLKQLLLKDLSARLPYGVKCKLSANGESLVEDLQLGGLSQFLYGRLDVLPYLRPMSSMTEEEETWATASYNYNKLTYGMDYAITAYVDYLYSIHIDCHDLISKGLALPAPEGMYDLKSKKEK